MSDTGRFRASFFFRMNMAKTFLSFFIIGFILNAQTKSFDVIGIKYYLNENTTAYNFINDLDSLLNYNINTIFVNPYNADKTFYNSSITKKYSNFNLEAILDSIKARNIKLGLILPVFFDSSKKDSTDLLAENSAGLKSNITWQVMICPSAKKYKNYKLELIKESIEKLKPEYLILDFIRFPVHWEEIDISKETVKFDDYCYCKNCQSTFLLFIKEKYGKNYCNINFIETIKNYKSDWYDWRATLITNFVQEVRNFTAPNIKIIINTIPWYNDFSDNALYKIAGQNLEELSMYSDYFSPMIYHKKINADFENVKKILIDQSIHNPLLPAIQVSKIDNEEYELEDIISIINHIKLQKCSKLILFDYNRLKNNYSFDQFKRIIK